MDREETVVNISGAFIEPENEVLLEESREIDGNHNYYEKNTDKIPSKTYLPQKPQANKVNLYDKYKDKHQKPKKPEKFTFPSPEKMEKNNDNKYNSYSSGKKNTDRKPNFFMPQSSRNKENKQDLQKMYKIFNENSMLLKKLSQKIKNPLSSKMKEDNYNYTCGSDVSALSTVVSPKVREFDTSTKETVIIEKKESVIETLEKTIVNIKNNEKKQKINERSENSEKKKPHCKDSVFSSTSDRKKNNTFHINENFEKKFSSAQKNTTQKGNDVQNMKKKLNSIVGKEEICKENSDKEFYSITSNDPNLLMIKIEGNLKSKNFKVKKVILFVCLKNENVKNR